MYEDCDALVGKNQRSLFSCDGLSLLPPKRKREESQNAENMQLKNREEENNSKSGSGHMDGGSGVDEDAEQPPKKDYHRHTARQIQEMEALFKECPHPDYKQRQRLSMELGLKPCQVKFWFQNRRTRMKAHQDRTDIDILSVENESLRNENLMLRERLKKCTCSNYGGPSLMGEMAYNELDRASGCLGGRTYPSLATMAAPPLIMGMGNLVKQSTDIMPMTCFTDVGIATGGGFMHMDKSLAMQLAESSADELIQMAQMDEPLWLKTNANVVKEVLNLDEYDKLFPWSMGLSFKHSNSLRTEATRDTSVVFLNASAIADLLMDVNKWMDIFACMVTRAKTVQVLSHGLPGHRNGPLQLMYAELQVLSPLVSTREIHFLRYSQQRAEGVWLVVDISMEELLTTSSLSLIRYRKRPSGCLIQDMPNGYSKVTWVEHVEAEDGAVHKIYQQLVSSGMALGAHRWLATLQRQCERLASFNAKEVSPKDIGGIGSPEGKRSMMRLSQRMINSFCSNVSASTSNYWTTMSGSAGDVCVQITARKNTELGQPTGVVICAATSFWLPIPPHRVFDFLRDEKTRSHWDTLSTGNLVQEVAHIANGSHLGNCISLLHLNSCSTSQNVELILQESCTDASGSIIVYAPVDVSSLNTTMSGEDPSYIPLLPCGFAILPDSPGSNRSLSSFHEVASSNGLDSPGGSLVTAAFQMIASNLSAAKVQLEAVSTMNNFICTTVQQIKAALNCPDI